MATVHEQQADCASVHDDDTAAATTQQQLKKSQSKGQTTAICSPRSILLCVILPLTNVTSMLWCYTALPLHFLDSEWPLWQLSLLLTVCYVPRVVGVIAFTRVGDWLCAPLAGVHTRAGSQLVWSHAQAGTTPPKSQILMLFSSSIRILEGRKSLCSRLLPCRYWTP